MSDTPRRPETRRLDSVGADLRTPSRPDTRPAAAGVPADDAGGHRPSAPAPPRRGKRPLGLRLVGVGAVLLLAAAAGAYVQQAVATVMQPSDWSDWLVTGGVGLVVAGLAAGCLGELRGLRDLRRLDGLNERARRARDDEVADDPGLIRDLKALYASREDLADRLRAFRRDAEGIGDVANQVAAFEMHVLSDLDARAQAAVARAVRRNATATALSPFAILDAAVTAWTSLRMIREVAALFGARPGAVATVRILRSAFANVVAAGLFDTAQDAVNDLVSGGLAGRVSTSMASAVANGLLTARLGLATVDACRPVPVSKGRRTNARALVRRSLSDVIGGRRRGSAPEAEA